MALSVVSPMDNVSNSIELYCFCLGAIGLYLPRRDLMIFKKHYMLVLSYFQGSSFQTDESLATEHSKAFIYALNTSHWEWHLAQQHDEKDESTTQENARNLFDKNWIRKIKVDMKLRVPSISSFCNMWCLAGGFLRCQSRGANSKFRMASPLNSLQKGREYMIEGNHQ